jgi:hypothetical protein
MYEAIYKEFGREATDIVRRELTARLNRMPSHIELYAEMCLRQGFKATPDPTMPNVLTRKPQQGS